jgi:hypothetical protein
MATQADVRRIALSFPGTEEGKDHFAFSVRNRGKLKGFAWVWMERVTPRKPRVPQPRVLAVRVANLEDKDFLLRLDPKRFFTEPHYDGFPAVLVRLPQITAARLKPLLREAWLCLAPAELTTAAAPLRRARSGGASLSPAQFRRLALDLPGAVEGAHMGHADFRVGGRIFATLGSPSPGWAMVKLPPMDQEVLLKAGGGAFQPAAGAWGKSGCTLVQLKIASKDRVRDALAAAHEAASRPRTRRAQ